jgi:hypothetical protein
MEEGNLLGGAENKTSKFIWLKFLLISSVIFIPIIIIGNVQSRAACYGQGFMCFPSFVSVIGLLGYGLCFLGFIGMGVVEFAKSRSQNVGISTRESAGLFRMYAFIVFMSLYRFVIHLETVIDYPRDGFKWEGQVLSLPFEIAILITLFIYIYKIANNWDNFAANASSSLLYSCVILAVVNAAFSLLEVGLIYQIVF